MFGNSNHNAHSSSNPTTTTWHPIGNSSSYDLWELPHPASRVFDDEIRDQPDQTTSPSSPSSPSSQQYMTFEFDNQVLTPILSSWSFQTSTSFYFPSSSTTVENSRNLLHPPNRERLDSHSSTNTSRRNPTVTPTTTMTMTKKQTLGDATNTAPILRFSRSRFL